LVSYTLSGHARAKTQESAQLLSDRVPLLSRENHTGMLPVSVREFSVKPMEIRDVEGIEDTPAFSGEC